MQPPSRETKPRRLTCAQAHLTPLRQAKLSRPVPEEVSEGDIPFANDILKIIDERIRLLGLDRIEEESNVPRTVVLTPAQLA